MATYLSGVSAIPDMYTTPKYSDQSVKIEAPSLLSPNRETIGPGFTSQLGDSKTWEGKM